MRMALLLAGASAIGIAFTSPAAAQIVFDPNNYAQNVLSAVRALEQINNQVRSLQNEAQALLNQAKNLTRLDASVLGDLKQSIARTKSLIDEAQGLSFEVSALERQFEQLYPKNTSASTSGEQILADVRRRWEQSRAALETAMKVQAQVSENLTSDEAALGDLVIRSQAATGNLDATQATNQLLALQARQAIDAARLALSQDRAVAAEQARVVAEEERAREVRRRFMGDGNSYTPAPVRLFHD